MQAPTHFLTGILIEKSTEKLSPSLLRRSVIAVTGVVSHGILDKIARATYHPPDPLLTDWFWVLYHGTIAFLSIYLLRRYWSKYKFGILLASLPDLEWFILHASTLLGIQLSFWKKPILHELLHSALDFFSPIALLNSIPDWRLERKGALIEIGLAAVLIALLKFLRDRNTV